MTRANDKLRINRALCELEDISDVSNIKRLNTDDLNCLRSMFAAGCSPEHIKKALESAGNGKTIKPIPSEVKETLYAEKVVRLTPHAYLTNGPTRTAYPIPDADLEEVTKLHLKGSHQEAKNALQQAINKAREKQGKTKPVVVEISTLKKKGVSDTILAELHSAIPAVYKAKNISTEFRDDMYEAKVGPIIVSGERDKMVKTVARILSYRRAKGMSFDDLYDLPGVDLEDATRKIPASS